MADNKLQGERSKGESKKKLGSCLSQLDSHAWGHVNISSVTLSISISYSNMSTKPPADEILQLQIEALLADGLSWNADDWDALAQLKA